MPSSWMTPVVLMLAVAVAMSTASESAASASGDGSAASRGFKVLDAAVSRPEGDQESTPEETQHQLEESQMTQADAYPMADPEAEHQVLDALIHARKKQLYQKKAGKTSRSVYKEPETEAEHRRPTRSVNPIYKQQMSEATKTSPLMAKLHDKGALNLSDQELMGLVNLLIVSLEKRTQQTPTPMPEATDLVDKAKSAYKYLAGKTTKDPNES